MRYNFTSLSDYTLNISKCLVILSVFVVSLFGLILWAYLPFASDTAPDTSKAARPAKIITVQSVSSVRAINLPALIEASRSTDLTFEVAGSLQQLLVKAGDDVKRGQVIARLDRRMFSNEVSTNQAQYNNALTEYRRAERLVKEDALARSVFEQRGTQLAVARAALDTAKIRQSDTVLRAPFSGVIADVVAERYENVGPGVPIAVLQTSGRAQAVTQVPAAIVANSGQIQPVETILTLDAAPDQEISTRLKSVTTQANPQTQSFEVRFDFTPPKGLLVLPGMTGTVRSKLALGDAIIKSDAVSVPLSALLVKGGKHFVWVVHPRKMTVTQREVMIDKDFGETIPVTKGLKSGEKVVATGAEYLRPGMKVRQFDAGGSK